MIYGAQVVWPPVVFFLLTASDETKRKMYSSILVVGGGLMFHGAQEFLLHRIINKMPPSFRRLVDNVEVITRPKVTGDVLGTVTQYTRGPFVLP